MRISKKSTDMEKKGTGKFAIRIWGWPTLIFYVLQLVLMAVFKFTSPDKSKYFLEPESGRELLWDILLGILIVSYMWVLVYRYSIMTEKKLSFIAKWGTASITVLFVLGNSLLLIRYLLDG